MTKGYDERPLTLAPILLASFGLFLARSVRDRVKPPRPGRPGQTMPEFDKLELDEIFAKQSPVVFRKVASTWPVFDDYQPTQLREKYGKEKVAALTSTSNVFVQETAPVEVLEYDEIMDAIFENPKQGKKYYSRTAADNRPLADQLPKRVGTRTQSDAASSVWMGQAGNLTPLHQDPWHGLLIQLYGRKRVRLFPPDEYHNVYGRVPVTASDMYTELPSEDYDPDLEEFPKLRNSQYFDVTLDIGDILYIPMFWWHQVESIDPAISYVARYNPNYFEFMRAAFFPLAVRGILRIVDTVKGLILRRR
ncbi:cupin-like domain-containing protein [Nocardia sp. NPDC046763]|uniref:cupin-like domain-containing protein n=1 Tax=Nocardia sp. NPDC046763 TaxID=3155256 RepID=UPI0033E3A81F